MRSSVDVIRTAEDEGLCHHLGVQAGVMLEEQVKLKQVTQQLENEKKNFKSISEHAIEKYHSDIKLITAVKALNFYGT